MRLRPSVTLILLLATFGVVACGEESTLDAAAESRSTPGTEATRSDDAALRRLREQGNDLPDGGRAAFEARLAELLGTPVVVNQWASWCPPCRAEFPIFQRLSEQYAGRVAFLGVDMQDDRRAALEFMNELPTEYPHFFDEDASISRLFGGGRVSPTTGIYDAAGRLVFTHLGAYANDAQLDAEVRRYALG